MGRYCVWKEGEAGLAGLQVSQLLPYVPGPPCLHFASLSNSGGSGQRLQSFSHRLLSLSIAPFDLERGGVGGSRAPRSRQNSRQTQGSIRNAIYFSAAPRLASFSRGGGGVGKAGYRCVPGKEGRAGIQDGGAHQGRKSWR